VIRLGNKDIELPGSNDDALRLMHCAPAGYNGQMCGPGGMPPGLPNYVSGTDPGRDGIDVFSFGAAYLGQAYYPFSVPGDPSSPSFEVKNIGIVSGMSERLDDRARLLNGLDHLRRTVDRSGAMDAMDEYNRKAFDLLTSNKARDAFDLSCAGQVADRVDDMLSFGERRHAENFVDVLAGPGFSEQ